MLNIRRKYEIAREQVGQIMDNLRESYLWNSSVMLFNGAQLMREVSVGYNKERFCLFATEEERDEILCKLSLGECGLTKVSYDQKAWVCQKEKAMRLLRIRSMARLRKQENSNGSASDLQVRAPERTTRRCRL